MLPDGKNNHHRQHFFFAIKCNKYSIFAKSLTNPNNVAMIHNDVFVNNFVTNDNSM